MKQILFIIAALILSFNILNAEEVDKSGIISSITDNDTIAVFGGNRIEVYPDDNQTIRYYINSEINENELQFLNNYSNYGLYLQFSESTKIQIDDRMINRILTRYNTDRFGISFDDTSGYYIINISKEFSKLKRILIMNADEIHITSNINIRDLMLYNNKKSIKIIFRSMKNQINNFSVINNDTVSLEFNSSENYMQKIFVSSKKLISLSEILKANIYTSIIDLSQNLNVSDSIVPDNFLKA